MQKFFFIFLSKLCTTVCFIICSINSGYSENFSDTIHIKPVIISADRISGERAGVTTTRIDSVAMINALTANLSELVSQNTSIFIKEYGRGAMATASFRGTAPSHTQVLWNGINLNSPMLGMVDFSTIPVYFIDNVTLLHGPGSLSESSGALGGIIRLQNTLNFQNKISGRLLTGIGSYGTIDEFLQLSIGNSKIQSNTRAFYNYSDNDYAFLNKLNADIDPITGEYIYSKTKNLNAEYKNFGILQELGFSLSKKDILNIRYWYQHNNRSLPRLLTNESDINSNINNQEEDAHRASVEWKNYGENGIFSINSGINAQYMSYWLKTKVFGREDQFAVDSESRSVSWYNNLRYNYQFSDDFSLSTGIDADIHDVESQNTPQNSDSIGYKENRFESAAFFQLSKNFGERLAANILGRQNIVDNRLTPFTPSLGVEYRPFNDQSFFIKTNLSKNYHLPSLDDLYYVPGGNPDLKPEEGFTTDLGTGFTRLIGKATFTTSLNGYLSRINNWIIWIPNTGQGYWTPMNMKRVNVTGLEYKATLKGNYKQIHYRFNGNYSYTRSINKDDPENWGDESIGKQLPYIPVHSANFSADLLRKGFHITWIWNYYSKRFTTTSSDKESKLDVIYPYIMNNLSVGKEIALNKKKINIELKIMNLLDEDYRTVLQHPMPGRNYSLLLRYDF